LIALAVNGAFDESRRDFTFPTPAGMFVCVHCCLIILIADGVKIRLYLEVLKPVYDFVTDLEGEQYVTITRGEFVT